MRNLFRVSALGLVLAVLALQGYGCKPNSHPLRVAVFTTDPQLILILKKTVQDIESRHPGLSIRLENIPYESYQEKLTTEMAGGDAPDIISVEVNNFVDLYSRGALEDLQPYFKKDGLDPKAYYSSILQRFSPGGGLYAIPSDIAPMGVMYYNKKIFDECGVPYPTNNWKWPEPFLSICKKLVKRDATGKIVRWAYAEAYGTIGDNFLLSNGGYYTDSETNPTRLALDSPQAIEAYRFRQDMIWRYHVAPSPSELLEFSFGGGGGQSMFMNGQIAMMCSGLWHTPNFLATKGLDFDVVEFPKGPHGTRGWLSGGTGYSIWKGSKNKEMAWTVLKELTGEALISQLASTGMIQPALVKVANSDAFLKAPGPAHKKIVLDMPRYSHFTPLMQGWDEIWKGQVGPEMDKVWLGTVSPEKLFPKLTADVNRKYFSKK